MPDKQVAGLLRQGAARLKEGQARMLVLGPVSIAYYRGLFAPIIEEEQLQNVEAALGLSLVSLYPTLQLQDPDALLGAIEMSMIIGMLAGSRHALEIPAELASLVQPIREAHE